MHEGERPITLDANVCTRAGVIACNMHTPRTQAHSPKGGRVQCMYLTSMVLQCSVHALQLTAPQHTAGALVNFYNAVLAARASLKRFTLEFVHALDNTNWIKPIFWQKRQKKKY